MVKVTVNGTEYRSITQAYGFEAPLCLSLKRVYKRIARGWSPERAVSTPRRINYTYEENESE